MTHRIEPPPWRAAVDVVGRLTQLGLVSDLTIETEGPVPVFVLQTVPHSSVVLPLALRIARRQLWGRHVRSVVAQQTAVIEAQRERTAIQRAWIEDVRSHLTAA